MNVSKRKVTFDIDNLLLAIEKKRIDMGITLSEVSDQAGVAKSTLCRIRQRGKMNVDVLVNILAWLGQTDIGSYIVQCDTDATSREIPGQLSNDQWIGRRDDNLHL